MHAASQGSGTRYSQARVLKLNHSDLMLAVGKRPQDLGEQYNKKYWTLQHVIRENGIMEYADDACHDGIHSLSAMYLRKLEALNYHKSRHGRSSTSYETAHSK